MVLPHPGVALFPFFAPFALASGSADVELLPPLPAEIAPGVPETPSARRGTLRGTLALQYELAPLVASEEGVEFGAVVRNRLGGWAAAELHPAPGLSLGLGLPVAGQWGGEVPFLRGDGIGAGDPRFSLSVGLLRTEGTDVHARLALAAPVGARSMWLGDAGVRADLSLGGRVGTRVRAGWVLGTTIRDASGADRYLGLGSEVWGRFGVTTRTGPVAPVAAVALRAGVRGVVDGSPAVAIEPLVGLGIPLGEETTLNVTGGRGLTAGYGTTDLRVRAVLTWRHPPNPRPPPPPLELEVLEIEEPPDLDVVLPPPPEPEPEPEPEVPRISLDHQILFPRDSAALTADAIRVVDEVAVLLFVHPEVDHVVIEGRASDEADHGYNYALSEARARAVFEALVARGVHPERLSWRAMGEVRHSGPARADDRKVVFEVTRYADERVERPVVPRPWDGQEPPR